MTKSGKVSPKFWRARCARLKAPISPSVSIRTSACNKQRARVRPGTREAEPTLVTARTAELGPLGALDLVALLVRDLDLGGGASTAEVDADHQDAHLHHEGAEVHPAEVERRDGGDLGVRGGGGRVDGEVRDGDADGPEHAVEHAVEHPHRDAHADGSAATTTSRCVVSRAALEWSERVECACRRTGGWT
jgi:hypothetical protein